MAMDRGAIDIFQEEGQIFRCQKDRWDAIFYGELGSSLAILEKGFNLDSFLPRYNTADLASASPGSVLFDTICTTHKLPSQKVHDTPADIGNVWSGSRS